MVAIDVFNTEAFKMFGLTAAINKGPYQPKYLRDLGIFQQKPQRTTLIGVEEKQGTLSILSTAARGTIKDVRSEPKRKIRDFRIPHVPYYQTMLADDIQNIRAFGSESELKTFGNEVNTILDGMRADHETTHEFHRIGAVQGQVLDGDNSTVIYNYFTQFGVTELDLPFDFTGSASYKEFCNSVTRNMADALGMTSYRKILAICGDNYFDAVTSHASVTAGYERWESSKFFRDSQLGPEYNSNTNGFDFANITFVNYRGKIGDVDFFPTDEARFIPLGVPDLFIEAVAPADMNGVANTLGKPFYASREILPHQKGVELHTQSNTLYIPTRPRALIKSTGTFS